MAYSHRISDSRSCGAVTVQQGQDFVTINGKLWAVEGDPNNHTNGKLIHSQDYVTIAGKLVILRGDSASADNQGHSNPSATGYDDLVDVT
jgi:uncharacterized Zn-binding protein involved in type VI secretion